MPDLLAFRGGFLVLGHLPSSEPLQEQKRQLRLDVGSAVSALGLL